MAAPMILSLGSINADLEFRCVTSLEKRGTVRTQSFAERAGGKAANVAFFTQRLDVPTRLLARIGNDQYAEIATAPLRQAGLDLSGVTRSEACHTGIAIVAIAESGEKTMLNASNANMEWDGASIGLVDKIVRNASEGSILVVDFEIPKDVLIAAFKAAQRRKLVVLADPTFPEEIDRSLFHWFDAITPNQSEAEGLVGHEITGTADAVEAARALWSCGIRSVCLKLADGGCVFCRDNHISILEAPQVEVKDKTGAGDAFIGAFSVALLEGRSSCEAARWGVAASSLSVTKIGAQASYPTRPELFEFLKDHQ